MQAFLTIQIISPNEKFLFMGNRVKTPIQVVETYRLILDIMLGLEDHSSHPPWILMYNNKYTLLMF